MNPTIPKASVDTPAYERGSRVDDLQYSGDNHIGFRFGWTSVRQTAHISKSVTAQ